MFEKGPPRRATLDPKLDIVFWMLFAAEQNRQLLLSLLNAVLDPAVAVASVEVLHAEPAPAAPGDKEIALDLRVRLASGAQADVEMQTRRHPALRERALYYWARLYSSQLQRGDFYTELRPCVVILITDFVELATSRFHSTFRAQELHDGQPLTDHLELHLLELPKLHAAVERNEEPNLVAWARFLAATTDEELSALAMENSVLKQAKEALDQLSADPDARARAEHRETVLLAHQAGLAKAQREARERGHAEGHAEGLAEGRVEVLRRQLTLKFGALPARVTARLASATAAELLSWSDQVLSATTLANIFDLEP